MNNKKAHYYWAFRSTIKICYLVTMCRLLSDAKPAEYRPEDFVSSDFAGDLSEMIECSTDIDGKQVGGDDVPKSFTDGINCYPCLLQFFQVTGVGDNGAA